MGKRSKQYLADILEQGQRVIRLTGTIIAQADKIKELTALIAAQNQVFKDQEAVLAGERYRIADRDRCIQALEAQVAEQAELISNLRICLRHQRATIDRQTDEIAARPAVVATNTYYMGRRIFLEADAADTPADSATAVKVFDKRIGNHFPRYVEQD